MNNSTQDPYSNLLVLIERFYNYQHMQTKQKAGSNPPMHKHFYPEQEILKNKNLILHFFRKLEVFFPADRVDSFTIRRHSSILYYYDSFIRALSYAIHIDRIPYSTDDFPHDVLSRFYHALAHSYSKNWSDLSSSHYFFTAMFLLLCEDFPANDDYYKHDRVRITVDRFSQITSSEVPMP